MINFKNRGGSRHWTIPLAFSGPTFTFKEIPANV